MNKCRIEQNRRIYLLFLICNILFIKTFSLICLQKYYTIFNTKLVLIKFDNFFHVKVCHKLGSKI
jgi:hypothetical protein